MVEKREKPKRNWSPIECPKCGRLTRLGECPFCDIELPSNIKHEEEVGLVEKEKKSK